MSYAQSMPRSVATAIVKVVADDGECRRFIPEVSPYAIGQKAAGSLRNLTNMTAEGAAWLGMKAVELVGAEPHATRMAKDYWEKQGMDQACTNIADVTSRAINAGIRQGAIPAWVTDAWHASRMPQQDNNVFAYHSATAVKVQDGKVYVFDWHATLSLRNPLISRNLAEWERGHDKYRVLYSVFQGWG
ncbi:MAG: hypothetical protein MUC89_03550 [Acetobacteraceae bacterium]|jgi:hypothetical protein|nr:hypothetical protein [Acetobacteraceae bacterium]